MFSRRWWWTTIIVILGIGVAIRMGIWQLDRNRDRQARIREIKSVQDMPVLDLNQEALPTDLSKMEYRKVTVSGEFDFNHQVALRNQIWTQTWGDEPGFALLTPLMLPDGQSVLVERGWIPNKYDTPQSWQEFDEPGIVTIEGILRLPMEKGEMGGGVPDPTLEPGENQLDFWNFVNLGRLQKQIPYTILDVYIQQSPADNNQELPFEWIAQPDLDPGAHIGFALMWFFYAGLLLFGYPAWLKKQNLKGVKQNAGK